ncbi:hypothetical protein [Salsuginibacillus kocurii]|uniref:hypothetical protein n=1 Tax=Salsuginibacillus kocurii TaxID=427078 RepID=UPI00036310D3|nr:hypothetical protein [Salsuginibacillus kocurii]
MKRKKMLVLTSLFLLIAGGCSTSSQTTVLPDELGGELSILFFSDQQLIEKEKPYYDVLLEFTSECRDNQEIIHLISTNDTELSQAFNVDSYPTIMVFEDDQKSEKWSASSLDPDDIAEQISAYSTCN